MELTIQGKQVDIGDALREHVESTLPKSIGKYFDSTTDASVTFSKRNNNFVADVQVHVSKRVIVQGHGEGRDAYIALSEAEEHALKRLRRYKRRLKDHKQAMALKEAWPVAQYILAPEPEIHHDDHNHQEPEQPLVIAEMAGEVESLSVAEAVMRMDLAHLPALLFRNQGTDRINMVYYRKDGNIAWVDPKIN